MSLKLEGVENVVTVSLTEYQRLLHDSKVLNALYAGGVDNWEWYGEALENMEDDD